MWRFFVSIELLDFVYEARILWVQSIISRPSGGIELDCCLKIAIAYKYAKIQNEPKYSMRQETFLLPRSRPVIYNGLLRRV